MKTFFLRHRFFSVCVIILVIAGVSLILLKDRIALGVITRAVRRSYPGCEIGIKGLHVGVGRIRADVVVFKVPVGKPPQVWSGRLSDVTASFFPWKVFASPRRALRGAGGVLDRLAGPGFVLEEGVLRVDRAPEAQPLILSAACEKVSVYNKEIADVTVRAILLDDRLDAISFDGRFLGAFVSMTGKEAFFRNSSLEMEGRLVLMNLDVARLIEAFDLEKRVEATGVYTGELDFALRSGRLKVLSGSVTNVIGGRLRVADVSLLKGAGVGEQAGHIVVENLKDFDYDRGEIAFGLEDHNVKLGFMLEGAAGSRRLEVVWHPAGSDE